MRMVSECLMMTEPGSSSPGVCPRDCAQPRYVAHRGDAEEALVFPIEVRGVVVPHTMGRTGRVEAFSEEQAPGFQEPQPLLVLRRAHRRDRLEMVLQTGDAHAQFACEAIDTKRLIEVFRESFDCSGDVGRVPAQERHLTQAHPVLQPEADTRSPA